jgi:hypothetical protein
MEFVPGSERPKRLAFVHIMRTGGDYVNTCLCQLLGDEYQLQQSWLDGLERDWTRRELVAFAELEGPVFVHNHVVNWDVECIEIYKRAGFFLFTFVRDVGDQLCSLYFWMKERDGIPADLSLDEFIRLQVSRIEISDIDYRHWEIPPYWRKLDDVAVFSEVALARFVEGTLGSHWDSHVALTAHRNESQNLGYCHYCGTGQIDAETQRLVNESDSRRRFLAIRGSSRVREGGSGTLHD